MSGLIDFKACHRCREHDRVCYVRVGMKVWDKNVKALTLRLISGPRWAR